MLFRSRIDHIDLRVADQIAADCGDITRICVGDLVCRNIERPRKNLIGDLFWRRATVCRIELDAKVAVLAAGVVAGRQDNPAIGLDRKSTRLNSSHDQTSYDVFGL